MTGDNLIFVALVSLSLLLEWEPDEPGWELAFLIRTCSVKMLPGFSVSWTKKDELVCYLTFLTVTSSLCRLSPALHMLLSIHYSWFLLALIMFLYVVLLDMAPDVWPRQPSQSPPSNGATWVLGLIRCAVTHIESSSLILFSQLCGNLQSQFFSTGMSKFKQWKYFFPLETQWSLGIVLCLQLSRRFQTYPHLQFKLRLILLLFICYVFVTQYS